MTGFPDRPKFGVQPPSGGQNEPGVVGHSAPASPPADGTVVSPEPNITGLARDRARAAQVSPFSNDEPTQTPTPFATGQARKEPDTTNPDDVTSPAGSPAPSEPIIRRSAADDRVASEPTATQERTVVVAARRDRPTTRGRISNTESGHLTDTQIDITSRRRITTNTALPEKLLVKAAKEVVTDLSSWRQSETDPRELQYEDTNTGWKFIATAARSPEEAEQAVTLTRRIQRVLDSRAVDSDQEQAEIIRIATASKFRDIQVAPVLAAHHATDTNQVRVVHQDLGGRRVDMNNVDERSRVYQVIGKIVERLNRLELSNYISPNNIRIDDATRSLIFYDFGQVSTTPPNPEITEIYARLAQGESPADVLAPVEKQRTPAQLELLRQFIQTDGLTFTQQRDLYGLSEGSLINLRKKAGITKEAGVQAAGITRTERLEIKKQVAELGARIAKGEPPAQVLAPVGQKRTTAQEALLRELIRTDGLNFEQQRERYGVGRTYLIRIRREAGVTNPRSQGAQLTTREKRNLYYGIIRDRNLSIPELAEKYGRSEGLIRKIRAELGVQNKRLSGVTAQILADFTWRSESGERLTYDEVFAKVKERMPHITRKRFVWEADRLRMWGEDIPYARPRRRNQEGTS